MTETKNKKCVGWMSKNGSVPCSYKADAEEGRKTCKQCKIENQREARSFRFGQI